MGVIAQRALGYPKRFNSLVIAKYTPNLSNDSTDIVHKR